MHDVTIALKKKQVSFSFKTATRHELETFLEDLKRSRKASEYQKTIHAIQQRIGIKSETESNDKTNFLGSDGEAKVRFFRVTCAHLTYQEMFAPSEIITTSASFLILLKE